MKALTLKKKEEAAEAFDSFITRILNLICHYLTKWANIPPLKTIKACELVLKQTQTKAQLIIGPMKHYAQEATITRYADCFMAVFVSHGTMKQISV